MSPKIIIDTDHRSWLDPELQHPSQKWIDKRRKGGDELLVNLTSMKGGDEITKCISCGICSASCPTRDSMQYSPRQIIGFVNRGLNEEALTANTIWLCVSCSRCEVRCPRDLDTNKVLKLLREIALLERPGSNPISKKAIRMHELFEGQVRNNGRITEMPLALKFNFPFGILSQLGLGFKMMSRGKANPIGLMKGFFGFGLQKNENPDRVAYLYEHLHDPKKKENGFK